MTPFLRMATFLIGLGIEAVVLVGCSDPATAPVAITRTAEPPPTRAGWQTRRFGPHAVPEPFHDTSNGRYLGGASLDAYWTGVLSRPEPHIGDRFIAPRLATLSVAQLERLIAGTTHALWVAGPVPLEEAALPTQRRTEPLSFAFPDVTSISDETLQQLDAIAHTLVLDGLPALSASQVAILGTVETERVTRDGRRQEQPVPDGTLSLRGVQELGAEDLAALASANEGLWLSFPDGLTPEQATALVGGRSRTLHLYALPHLPPEVAEILVEGSLHKLYVEVAQLDRKTAAVLRGFSGHTLELVIHEALSPRAAQNLSQLPFTGDPRHPAKNRGRLVLSLSQLPAPEVLAHLGTLPWLTFRGPSPLEEAEQIELIGSGQFRNLGPVLHVGDAAARAMEASGGRFHLHGLESASGAAITAGLGRWFQADDLRRVDADAARALAQEGVHQYTLDGLDADAAEALVTEGLRSWKTNETLAVHTTEPLSAATLEALGHYRSAPNAFRRLQLSSSAGLSPEGIRALARSCAAGGDNEDCGLELSGVRTIDEALAQALETLRSASLRRVEHVEASAFLHLCRIFLREEKSLQLHDDAQARAYAAWKTCSNQKRRIHLQALQTLTPGMATAFASTASELVLEIDTLSGDAARALAKVASLRLTVRERIDADAAAGLAQFQGPLQLRLEAPLDAAAARALGSVTGERVALTYAAPLDAEVMAALASASGRLDLDLQAAALTPELAAVLPRAASSGQTVLDVPDLSLAATEALTDACAARGGCGPLDLTAATGASTAALEYLFERWSGGLLLLPDRAPDDWVVPCTKPHIDTAGCEQLRAMEAFENHVDEGDDNQ